MRPNDHFCRRKKGCGIFGNIYTGGDGNLKNQLGVVARHGGLRSETTAIDSVRRVCLGDVGGGVFVVHHLRHAVLADTGRRCQDSAADRRARVEVWASWRENFIARGVSDPQGQVYVAPLTHKAYRFGPSDPLMPAGRVRVSVSFGAGRTQTIALVPAM